MASSKSHTFPCLDVQSDVVQAGKGKNIIPPPPRESLWKGFIGKFKDPIIIILLVVFVFSVGVSVYEIFVQGKTMATLIEPLGVLVALLLATGVGFLFEVRAAREFDVLNKVKDHRKVKVSRIVDGRVRVMEIPKHDVVVGDVVHLEGGDEVPADGVLLESQTLRVDESNFTGELYANKNAHPDEEKAVAAYAANVMLRSSIVIEGRGVMLVEKTGVDTEEGHGVMKSAEGSDVKTPLNQQLDRLGKFISVASFVVGGLILAGRILFYFLSIADSPAPFDWMEFVEVFLNSVMIAVTLIVVAVPEGLPLSITLSLALSMRKMLKQNNLVRKLHACETMGATTVICTDKTGTLTQNHMKVTAAVFPDEVQKDFLMQCIAINSTAELSVDEHTGKIQPIGNPTEGALLQWVQSQGYDYASLREAADVKSCQPFSTETKMMQTTVVLEGEATSVTLIKGAPEIVLNLCTAMEGGMNRQQVLDQLLDMQNHAMRTLAFAYQREGGIVTFMGMVGISDPVREDVPEAISICRNKAGVRVIIVTGDTSGTAMEIGRQVGLIEEGDGSTFLTGAEFAALSDEEAKKVLADKHFKVISRARPDDKARLVVLLQQLGEVVAVTGDGTNDAPALSKAQVGLSMGDGTSRAKEASDITIIDNSFASINNAIMWGRSLYLNIKRFILFQMTVNVCACLIVLLGAFMGLESPLTVTQMLWVNLIMDTFAAIALSSLPADPKVMYHRPRNPKSNIIDRGMAWRTLGVGFVLFLIMGAIWQLMWHLDIRNVTEMFDSEHWQASLQSLVDFSISSKSEPAPEERSIFFTFFVLLQFWNIFNAKYYRTDRSLLIDLADMVRRNGRWRNSFSLGFLFIVLAILVGQVLIVECGGEMFNTCKLSASEWMWTLLVTSPVLIIPEIVRTFFRRIQ